MIDPLHRVSVRTKLALMFVSLCLIAYGVGGFLVSRGAEGALEKEILTRLDFQCRAYATALDASLQLFEQRLEDFASDGYIRDHAARLEQDGTEPLAHELRDALRRHLTRNKLPLVQAYRDLAVTDNAGQLLAAVHPDASRWLALARSPPADPFGRMLLGVDGQPSMVLSTPVWQLDRERTLGRLRVLISLEDWVRQSLAMSAGGHAGRDIDVRINLHDREGQGISTSISPIGTLGPMSAATPPNLSAGRTTEFAPVQGRYARAFPIADSGWSLEVTLRIDEALRPVSGLQSRLLGVGLVLGLISTLLLFFPMRFVVRPLVLLTNAAERLREGELDTRVEVESNDEIGELGRAFNGMAGAIQERTDRLETIATDLRARQGELRSERDRLDAVIASMHDGLAVLDAQGRVVLANAAARPLLDVLDAGEEAHSHNLCREPAPAAHGNATHPGAPVLAATAEEPAGGSDCFACLLQPEGPPRSCAVDVGSRAFEIHTTPLPPDECGGRGRVLVSREVTDRIAQDEREIHNERLAVLGEVAAVVAHELNNPLASISMFNQMLAAALPADSPLHENTDVIARNTDSAKHTIRELLDYATGASPEVDVIDMHDTLEDVARFLRPLSERAGVAIHIERTAEHSEVTGDEVQLRQVLVNLTLNAIQAVTEHGPAGGKALPREHEPGTPAPASSPRSGRIGDVFLTTSDHGERLVVDVRDTGPGISPADRERIFRPFFTTKPRGDGTGLGLSTARRIAEMHGGSLSLVESSSTGTVFRVTLRARVPCEVSA